MGRNKLIHYHGFFLPRESNNNPHVCTIYCLYLVPRVVVERSNVVFVLRHNMAKTAVAIPYRAFISFAVVIVVVVIPVRTYVRTCVRAYDLIT